MLMISHAKSKVLNTVLNVDILMTFLSIFSWLKESFSNGENMQVIGIVNNYNMAQRATAELSPVKWKLFCRWCTKTNLCRLHFHSAHCDLFSDWYDQLSSCSSRIQQQSFCRMQQHKNNLLWQGVLHWLHFKCMLHTQFVLSASPPGVNTHTQRHTCTHTIHTVCIHWPEQVTRPLRIMVTNQACSVLTLQVNKFTVSVWLGLFLVSFLFHYIYLRTYESYLPLPWLAPY